MRGRWSAISLFYSLARKEERGNDMCILESERLRLRPPRPSDIHSMTVWLSDYDVARMTSRAPHPYGESDAEAFVAEGEPHRLRERCGAGRSTGSPRWPGTLVAALACLVGDAGLSGSDGR